MRLPFRINSEGKLVEDKMIFIKVNGKVIGRARPKDISPYSFSMGCYVSQPVCQDCESNK